jgi:hypothetical protein
MNDFKVRYDMKGVKEIHDRIVVATARFYTDPNGGRVFKAYVLRRASLLPSTGQQEDLT